MQRLLTISVTVARQDVLSIKGRIYMCMYFQNPRESFAREVTFDVDL